MSDTIFEISQCDSDALMPEIKLLLLKEPVRRTIVTLRTIADEADGLDDDTQVSLWNMALWLEAVLQETPHYCSKSDIARAKRWDYKHRRQNDGAETQREKL